MELKVDKPTGGRRKGGSSNKGKIIFINDDIVVRYKNNTYTLDLSIKNIKPYLDLKSITLYSRPTNKKHSPFTKRENVDISNKSDKHLEEIFKHWSPYKEGQLVRGEIKNNKFQIR